MLRDISRLACMGTQTHVSGEDLKLVLTKSQLAQSDLKDLQIGRIGGKRHPYSLLLKYMNLFSGRPVVQENHLIQSHQKPSLNNQLMFDVV